MGIKNLACGETDFVLLCSSTGNQQSIIRKVGRWMGVTLSPRARRATGIMSLISEAGFGRPYTRTHRQGGQRRMRNEDAQPRSGCAIAIGRDYRTGTYRAVLGLDTFPTVRWNVSTGMIHRSRPQDEYTEQESSCEQFLMSLNEPCFLQLGNTQWSSQRAIV